VHNCTGSVGAQLEVLPLLTKSASQLFSGPLHKCSGELVAVCYRVLFGVLFQPCSAHLHQHLVSALKKCTKSPTADQHACNALYHILTTEEQRWESCEGARCTHLPIGPAWASVLRVAPNLPEDSPCVAKGVLLLARQLDSAIDQINSGAHALPQVADDVQVCSLNHKSGLKGSYAHRPKKKCGRIIPHAAE
jgi:hypothetical protein